METFSRPRTVPSRSQRKLDALHESIRELEKLATKLERYTNPKWRDAQDCTMYRKGLDELLDELQYMTAINPGSSSTNVWMLSEEDRATLFSIANRAGSVVLYQTESLDMLATLLDTYHYGVCRVSYNREYVPETLLERLQGWSVIGLELSDVSQTRLVYLGGKQPQDMLLRYGFTLEVHRQPSTTVQTYTDGTLEINNATLDLGYTFVDRRKTIDRKQSLFTDAYRSVCVQISPTESINKRSRHDIRTHELTYEYN